MVTSSPPKPKTARWQIEAEESPKKGNPQTVSFSVPAIKESSDRDNLAHFLEGTKQDSRPPRR